MVTESYGNLRPEAGLPILRQRDGEPQQGRRKTVDEHVGLPVPASHVVPVGDQVGHSPGVEDKEARAGGEPHAGRRQHLEILGGEHGYFDHKRFRAEAVVGVRHRLSVGGWVQREALPVDRSCRDRLRPINAWTTWGRNAAYISATELQPAPRERCSARSRRDPEARGSANTDALTLRQRPSVTAPTPGRSWLQQVVGVVPVQLGGEVQVDQRRDQHQVCQRLQAKLAPATTVRLHGGLAQNAAPQPS